MKMAERHMTRILLTTQDEESLEGLQNSAKAAAGKQARCVELANISIAVKMQQNTWTTLWVLYLMSWHVSGHRQQHMGGVMKRTGH